MRAQQLECLCVQAQLEDYNRSPASEKIKRTGEIDCIIVRYLQAFYTFKPVPKTELNNVSLSRSCGENDEVGEMENESLWGRKSVPKYKWGGAANVQSWLM